MVKYENNIKIFVPVNEVFPEVKNDFETFKLLLESLSLTDAIFWCARINIYISHPEVGAKNVEGQQTVISRFLTKENIDILNKFVKEKGDINKVGVFFSGQILELLRWVVRYSKDKEGDGSTFDNQENRINFVKTALIASDIWSKRVFKDRFKLAGGLDLARERALGAIRKSIEGQASAPIPEKTYGRGWSLFKYYFPKYYPEFGKNFQSITRLTVEEYYISINSLIIHFMKSNLDNNIFNINSLDNSLPFRDILKKYVLLESMTLDDLFNSLWKNVQENEFGEEIPSYNYKPLRAKPIFRTEDGRTIILDPRLFSERALIGPLFYLVEKYPNKANEIFSAFGYAFEDYAKDILSRMFPDSGLLYKRLTKNIKIISFNGEEREVDALLNDVREVIIFEMKAAWILEDEILTDNYEQYLQQIRKRYGVTEGSENDRKIKGVGQLARIISIVSTKKWLDTNKDFQLIDRFYPVIIVNDPFLSAPAHGNFLAEEFKTILCPDKELRSGEFIKNGKIIVPLIIMTIDELENMEDSIRNFGFKEFLKDYSGSYPDRMVSITNYICNSSYKNKICHNKNLCTKSMELIDKTKEKLFPSGKNKNRKQ